MNNDEIIPDDPEALLDEYEHRERPDDVPAMQAVVCILLATGLFLTNLMRPELGGELFGRLSELISGAHEVVRNPIELLSSLF